MPRPSRARTRSSSVSAATTRRISRLPAACLVPGVSGVVGGPEEIETPGATTIEDVAKLLRIDAAATSKAMPVVMNGTGRVGSRSWGRPAGRRQDARGVGPGVPPRPRTRFARRSAQIRARSGRRGRRSRSSPTKRFAGASSSPARTARGITCAASKQDATSAQVCEYSRGARGRHVWELRRRPSPPDAIEGEHIFKLDMDDSQPLGASSLDEDDREAARHGQLRNRARSHDGRGHRTASRR